MRMGLYFLCLLSISALGQQFGLDVNLNPVLFPNINSHLNDSTLISATLVCDELPERSTVKLLSEYKYYNPRHIEYHVYECQRISVNVHRANASEYFDDILTDAVFYPCCFEDFPYMKPRIRNINEVGMNSHCTMLSELTEREFSFFYSFENGNYSRLDILSGCDTIASVLLEYSRIISFDK
jgi:hypothetical protein